jgi:hypothetical protein
MKFFGIARTAVETQHLIAIVLRLNLSFVLLASNTVCGLQKNAEAAASQRHGQVASHAQHKLVRSTWRRSVSPCVVRVEEWLQCRRAFCVRVSLFHVFGPVVGDLL